jgi:hypothetical protein
MHRVVTTIVLGAAVIGLYGSCSARTPSTLDTTDLDPTLTAFSYIDDGKLVTFIVDARVAQIHKRSTYFPLEISVANRGLKNLALTRESFVLIDQDGNRYHSVAADDLIESYQFLDVDRGQAELAGIVDTRFANFTRYPATFSPTQEGGGVVQDRVTLPKWGYMIDLIYFPVPQTGLLDRRFELHMQSPDLPEPVFVKFAVR